MSSSLACGRSLRRADRSTADDERAAPSSATLVIDSGHPRGGRCQRERAPHPDRVRPPLPPRLTPHVVYGRRRLLEQVWGYKDGAGERTVDSHVRAHPAQARPVRDPDRARHRLRARHELVAVRPLDSLHSIKLKLGVVIVAAVIVTVGVVTARRAARTLAADQRLRGGGPRARGRPGAGTRDDLAAARDGDRGPRDGARRLLAAHHLRRRATRSASSPARSTRWPPSWRRSTGCAATSSRTPRTSSARRSAPCAPAREPGRRRRAGHARHAGRRCSAGRAARRLSSSSCSSSPSSSRGCRRSSARTVGAPRCSIALTSDWRASPRESATSLRLSVDRPRLSSAG